VTHKRVLLTVAAAFLIVLAGCSGASSPGSTPPDTPQSSTATPTPTSNGTLEVHFINVGQSVGTLIVGPTNETMLIDSGDFTNDGEYVLEYLKQHNIQRIDYFITSHNDADHIGGNAAVIDYFETEASGIGAVYDPGIAASTETYNDYLDAVEEHNVTIYETREGDSIPFEGVDVQVMGPPEPYLENEARNENSIVLKLTYGQTSFLFPGDAEDDQEAYLVDTYGQALNATILKAGHHGSSSSSSEPFLDAVSPNAVIISSAYDSRYDHPNQETLDRLAARSLRTYWTGTHGNIVLVSNGEQVTVKTQRDAPTDPSALRESDPIEPGTDGTVQPRLTIDGQQVTTPIATDGGTQTATQQATGGKLAISSVNADAAGDDGDNLNDEYVVFENTGGETLGLSGWTVSDEADHRYTFPDGVTLPAGETLTLHTGSGTDTESDLYWGSGQPIWNNAGDTVIVTKPDGTEVLREEYS
jgi:competence protein ComEC